MKKDIEAISYGLVSVLYGREVYYRKYRHFFCIAGQNATYLFIDEEDSRTAYRLWRSKGNGEHEKRHLCQLSDGHEFTV